MNNKQKELNRIVDTVIVCCASINEDGCHTITKNEVVGKCRETSLVMTRAILANQLMKAGYAPKTVSRILHRTSHAIRHLLDLHTNYLSTSRAYKIANDEADLSCKQIVNK